MSQMLMTIHQKHKSREFFFLILQAPRELKAKYAFKIFGIRLEVKSHFSANFPNLAPDHGWAFEAF